MARSLKMLLNGGLSVVVVVLALFVCLLIMDTPVVDTYSAAHVKRVRYPNMMHIWRDEDFSRYRSNSLGLLGDDPAPATDQSVYRIALFGDSFVEALQVPSDKHFAKLIEKQLAAQGLTDRRIEVWNFGFSGDNTGNAYARWRYRPKGYRFDLAVFTFNDGDLVENAPEDAPGADGAFLVSADGQTYTLDESRVGPETNSRDRELKRTFGQFFYTVYRVKNRTQDWIAVRRAKWSNALSMFGDSHPITVPTQHATRDALALASESFGQLRFVQKEFAREGVPLMLVGIPTPRIAIPGYKDEDPLRRAAYVTLSEQLRAVDDSFVDLLPPVQAQQSAGNDLYTDWDKGGHFNRVGHQLIADLITKGILRLPKAATFSDEGTHAVQ